MADRSPILVGIDRSAGSRLALARARSLAQETGASLVACAVLEGEADVPEAESARARLAALVPEAVAEIRAGRPFVELIRAAREVDAGLIVVGATGEHTEGTLALGATVDRVARKADRPVLVVRGRPENGYRSIAVGVDGSVEAAAAARLARQLAPAARITALLAVPPVGEHRLKVHRFPEEEQATYRERLKEEARRELDRHAAGLPVDERGGLLGRPEAALSEFARREGSDLVAVGRRGASPVPAILLGSTAHHLVHEAPCDVLVYRPHEIDFEPP